MHKTANIKYVIPTAKFIETNAFDDSPTSQCDEVFCEQKNSLVFSIVDIVNKSINMKCASIQTRRIAL